MTTIGIGTGEEQIEAVIELVTAAMNRNYPDITTEQVENLLDMGNANEIMTYVLTGSGLKPSSGEPRAVSNGLISMASSPPPADTAIQ